jgi:hypothetical protein
MRSPRETDAAALPGLVERLADLALVDIDVLTRRVEGEAARELVAAYVSDLEEALGGARILLRELHRELASGNDPLALLDVPSDRRSGNAAATADAAARLGRRAAARRELSRLEELVRGVLPRLLEADRRLAGL